MNPSNEVVSNLTSVKIPEPVISLFSDLLCKMLQNQSAPDAPQKRVRPSSERASVPSKIPASRFMYIGESEPIEMTSRDYVSPFVRQLSEVTGNEYPQNLAC